MRVYTLITGATSGIGLATARALCAAKQLILVGRSVDKLAELRSEFGENHLYFCCDLADVESVAENLTGFLQSHDAMVDKLIHCAGIDQTLPAKSLQTVQIDGLMRVNFYSVVEIIRVLLKHSVNHSALTNILFVSSISSIRGFKAKGAYSASKAALDGYMRVLAKELAPKVTVNSILPGAVPTPMSQSGFNNPDLVKHFEDIYPLGVGSVDQVVDVIVCHHNMDKLWITGQQIIVDGGITA
jgi:NAD(P)-dependent dehydrogenase (short-subunit alcohol dehydrogenase family)